MIKKLLPVVFLLVGLGAGIGAAVMTAPAPAPPAEDAEHAAEPGHAETDGHGDAEPEGLDAVDTPMVEAETSANSEFWKMSDQFVVPLVQGDRVASMVVLSLSLETGPEMEAVVYAREPKLRAIFLRVLFDHANMGGFHGDFTKSRTLDLLRKSLLEVAQREMGDAIRNVLIVDITRQDN